VAKQNGSLGGTNPATGIGRGGHCFGGTPINRQAGSSVVEECGVAGAATQTSSAAPRASRSWWPRTPNHVWAYDVGEDREIHAECLRLLTVIEFTREGLA